MNLRAATYDSKAKALYVYFEPRGSKQVVHTIPSPDGSQAYWDLDDEYNVLGVELLNIDLEDITHGSKDNNPRVIMQMGRERVQHKREHSRERKI